MPQTSTFPSVRTLDQLLDTLGVGAARRRQLDTVGGEQDRALQRGALPVGPRRSLRRLVEEEALGPYILLAESGALRHRKVKCGLPTTSEATSEIRRRCVGLLREALGLSAPVSDLGLSAVSLGDLVCKRSGCSVPEP
ncbi:hypothetical protein ACFU96_45550 [Streptomyces sp. NPDC057620]|uniref:hypothetical protein n=1 Tax=Streptomyces sp. NPDC057620 TaxID=3346185 RepID=UPI0036C2C20A